MKPLRNRKNIRLKNWDYRSPGAYFITITTKNREHYFGEIFNGEMILSPVGIIADILWYEIPCHVKNIELDAFVVMPNHIHGILILKNNDIDDVHVVGTMHASSLPASSPPASSKPPSDKNELMARISPKSGSISRIVGAYKSAVTKHAHRLGFEIIWQIKFYDHIIRNEKSLENIRNYIKNNPENWNEDKFFSD